MRKAQLLSTIAAAALLSTGAAIAQDSKGTMAPERAPAAQQNAPAEKMAPSMNAGERGSVGTTGQGTAQKLQPGAGGNADVDQRGTVGASSQTDRDSAGKAGAKTEGSSQTKAGAKAQDDDKKSDATQKSESDSNAQTKGAASGASEPSSKSAAEDSGKAGKSDTTGQGAAAGAAKLSSDQRTKITTVIKKQKVAPVEVNFEVNIGTQIPARVQYYSLPTEVIEVYPEWRGYYYILVSNRIVIIEPDTREVVYIIDA